MVIHTDLPVASKGVVVGQYRFKKYPAFQYTAKTDGAGGLAMSCMFHFLNFTQAEFNGMLWCGLLDRV